MNSAVARLYLRRTVRLRPSLALLFVLGLLSTWSRPAEWIARDAEGVRRALSVQTFWSASLWLLLPVVLAHAAGLPTRWRTRERDWIASRPHALRKLVPSATLGSLVGVFLWLGLVGAVAEFGAGAPAESDSWERIERAAGPPRGLVGEDGIRWTNSLARREGPLRARVHLVLAPGDSPFATVRWTATSGGEEALLEQVVTSRGSLDMDLPPSSETLDFELTRVGSGARLLIRDSTIEFFAPASSARMASVRVLEHVALLILAAFSLAIGIGSFLSTGATFTVVAGTWLTIWMAENPLSVLPGTELPRILAELHEGLVPQAPPVEQIVGTLACVLLSALLAGLAIRFEERTS